MDEVESTLALAISDLANKIEMLIEKHEELSDNMSQIKEAVYNPDSGLYARIRTLEQYVDQCKDKYDPIFREMNSLLNPIDGIHAKIKDIEISSTELQRWKSSNVRILWAVGTSILGLALATIWKMIF